MSKQENEKNIFDFSSADCVIQRPNLYKLLNNKNTHELIQLLKPLNSGVIHSILMEKESIAYFQKKSDLKFFKEMFKFLDRKFAEEESKYSDSFSVIVAQNSHPVKVNTKVEYNNVAFNVTWHKYETKTQENAEKFWNEKKKDLEQLKSEVLSATLKNKSSLDAEFCIDFLEICNGLKHFKAINKLAQQVAEKKSLKLFKSIFDSKVFKSHLSQQHFLRHAIYKTEDIPMLDYLYSQNPKLIKKDFDEMNKFGEFWWDFKPSMSSENKWQMNYQTKNFIWQTGKVMGEIDKMIWLENHEMGYSQINHRYLIRFLMDLNQQEFDTYIASINNPEKTIAYIQKSLNDYQARKDTLNEGEDNKSVESLYEKELSQYAIEVNLSDYSSPRISAYKKLHAFMLKYQINKDNENREEVKKTVKKI